MDGDKLILHRCYFKMASTALRGLAGKMPDNKQDSSNRFAVFTAIQACSGERKNQQLE